MSRPWNTEGRAKGVLNTVEIAKAEEEQLCYFEKRLDSGTLILAQKVSDTLVPQPSIVSKCSGYGGWQYWFLWRNCCPAIADRSQKTFFRTMSISTFPARASVLSGAYSPDTRDPKPNPK